MILTDVQIVKERPAPDGPYYRRRPRRFIRNFLAFRIFFAAGCADWEGLWPPGTGARGEGIGARRNRPGRAAGGRTGRDRIGRPAAGRVVAPRAADPGPVGPHRPGSGRSGRFGHGERFGADPRRAGWGADLGHPSILSIPRFVLLSPFGPPTLCFRPDRCDCASPPLLPPAQPACPASGGRPFGRSRFSCDSPRVLLNLADRGESVRPILIRPSHDRASRGFMVGHDRPLAARSPCHYKGITISGSCSRRPGSVWAAPSGKGDWPHRKTR